MIKLRALQHAYALLLGAAITAAGGCVDAVAQNKLPRLGVLTVGTPAKEPLVGQLEVFRRTLAREGWVEGKTATFVLRDAQSNPAKLGEAAADLIEQKIDVLFAYTAPAARAAFAKTKSLPLVTIDYTNDPVAASYAKSYARPGGNVTGVFLDAPEFAAKLLELLREAVPNLTRVAALWDPSPGDTHVKALRSAAESMGLQLQVLQVRKPEEIDTASDALGTRPQAIVVLPSPILHVEAARVVSLQNRLQLPVVSMFLPFPDAGGLLAYGPDDRWAMERVAIQVSKLLRGTKPGDLPIERPIKFDLIVNLTTAKALNIKLPESVLTRAERVVR